MRRPGLTQLGFNANVSAPALSETWLPAHHLQYFAWGGGVMTLCGQPLKCFLFDLLHTL